MRTRAPLTIPLEDGPVAAWLDRGIAASVVVVASALALVLAAVDPDVRGHGTHERLGLDVCGWPLTYGIPCPTCGCTTAACHVVHGHLLRAFVVQPFGAAIAIVGILLGAHALACLCRRRSFVDLLIRLPFWRVLGGALLLLLLAWWYKYLVFVP